MPGFTYGQCILSNSYGCMFVFKSGYYYGTNTFASYCGESLSNEEVGQLLGGN